MKEFDITKGIVASGDQFLCDRAAVNVIYSEWITNSIDCAPLLSNLHDIGSPDAASQKAEEENLKRM